MQLIKFIIIIYCVMYIILYYIIHQSTNVCNYYNNHIVVEIPSNRFAF